MVKNKQNLVDCDIVEKLDELGKKIDDVHSVVIKIDTTVFGKGGLCDGRDDQEKRIRKVEESQQKMLPVIGGIVAVATLLVASVVRFFFPK
jgi:hypothetical protein